MKRWFSTTCGSCPSGIFWKKSASGVTSLSSRTSGITMAVLGGLPGSSTSSDAGSTPPITPSRKIGESSGSQRRISTGRPRERPASSAAASDGSRTSRKGRPGNERRHPDSEKNRRDETDPSHRLCVGPLSAEDGLLRRHPPHLPSGGPASPITICGRGVDTSFSMPGYGDSSRLSLLLGIAESRFGMAAAV